MKVTTKGQVTIPQDIRKKLGIDHNSEVEFIEENGRVYLVRKKGNRFDSLRGRASVGMTTDEIMVLTRSE